MIRLIIAFAIALTTVAAVAAQKPSGSPSATPPPASTTSSAPAPSLPASPQRATALNRDQMNFPLNPVAESDRLSARVTRLAHMIAPMYKKPGGKQIAAILPDQRLVSKYAEFLKLEGTGIFRLVADSGCVFTERVVNVAQQCLKYPFPGAGNSFSFRTGGYRLRHLADITYVDDKLRITGIFMHGIIVDLGDVPIEEASLATDGMSSLQEFKPSTTSDDVTLIDENLKRGLKDGNFVYSKEVDPMVDRTYALRAVAYRGKVIRSMAGIRYNELEYDRRRDVIVAFRVVDMDSEGVTIVWRKLADIESPKIKMPKEKEGGADDNEGN